MKKTISFCVIFCLLLSAMCLEVYAVTDESTGVEYIIRNYRSTLSLRGADLRETGFHGELDNKILATGPSEVFNYWGDVTDAAFVEKRSEYRQTLYDWVERVSAHRVVARWNLVDGYDRTLTDSDYLILKYFNIPTDFKGTKTVQREGIPFVFTGDGNGNIKVAVEKGIEGHHEATLYIPEERIYDMFDDIFSERYSFTYIVPNSKTPTCPNGGCAVYSAESIQEGLEYCKNNADLSEPVYVDVTKDWRIFLNGKISYAITLNVEYGTTSTAGSMEKTNSTPTSKNGAEGVTNGNAQENPLGEMHTSPVEDISLTEGNILSDIDSTVSSVSALESTEVVEPANQSRKSTYIKIAGVCAAASITAGAGVLLYVFRFKKNPNAIKKHKK